MKVLFLRSSNGRNNASIYHQGRPPPPSDPTNPSLTHYTYTQSTQGQARCALHVRCVAAHPAATPLPADSANPAVAAAVAISLGGRWAAVGRSRLQELANP